jgi:hypothetical protein
MESPNQSITVVLSEGEVLNLANQHFRIAAAIPERFRQFVADRPKMSSQDLHADANRAKARIRYHISRGNDFLRLIKAKQPNS